MISLVVIDEIVSNTGASFNEQPTTQNLKIYLEWITTNLV